MAVVTGRLAWEYRQTCSKDRFDAAVAAGYVRDYTEHALALMERAAAGGAQLVLGPEYFRGSEMFTAPDADRRALVEPADGPTSRRLREISSRHNAALCCAYDAAHGEHMHQTAVLTTPDGRLAAVHVKHPRRVPAPPDWPFNTGVRVYDAGCATVGITVCSDCTYDPELPLAMARHGMTVLLVPGCGFAGDMWRHFAVVRARDTQSALLYADDGRGAIVAPNGTILAETDRPRDIIRAEVELGPRKCSPDA